MKADYIEVSAKVRYWEDSEVNDKSDNDGLLIPLRKNDCWCPIVRLADGFVVDWPEKTTASIHYKVCDAGEYFLLDANKNRVAKWCGEYVPDKFLCHGDDGFGDYIIFNVDGSGMIEKWRAPSVSDGEWEPIT